MGKNLLKVLFEQLIMYTMYTFGKILCDRVYFWASFYVTGVQGVETFSTHPVTSLVKHSPGFNTC